MDKIKKLKHKLKDILGCWDIEKREKLKEDFRKELKNSLTPTPLRLDKPNN